MRIGLRAGNHTRNVSEFSVPMCLHWKTGHFCSESKWDEAHKQKGVSIHRERKISSFTDSQCFRRERRLRCSFFLLEDLFLFYPRLHAPLSHVNDFEGGVISWTPLLLADTETHEAPISEHLVVRQLSVSVSSNQHSIQEGAHSLPHSDWVSMGHVTPWDPMRPLGTSGEEPLAAPPWIPPEEAAKLLPWEQLGVG